MSEKDEAKITKLYEELGTYRKAANYWWNAYCQATTGRVMQPSSSDPEEDRAIRAMGQREHANAAIREAVMAMFCPGQETPYLAKRGWTRSPLGDRKWWHTQHGNVLHSHIEAIGIELRPLVAPTQQSNPVPVQDATT